MQGITTAYTHESGVSAFGLHTGRRDTRSRLLVAIMSKYVPPAHRSGSFPWLPVLAVLAFVWFTFWAWRIDAGNKADRDIIIQRLEAYEGVRQTERNVDRILRK